MSKALRFPLSWRRASIDEQRRLTRALLQDACANLAFMVLVIASCAIATFGLLENSAAVIIGAMIIAPLLPPIQGLAFGALEGQVHLFRRSLATLLVGTAVSIAVSYVLGLLVGFPTFGSEVLSRSRPTLLDLAIAIAAGAVGGFARVRAELSATVAGTAISVALMPPLCVVGLGLAHRDSTLSVGAGLLYVTNLLGIVLACMAVFLLSGYTTLERARTAMFWALLLTAALVAPLGASLIQLVHQTQLQYALKNALLNRTVTFHRVELVDAQFNWLTSPPQVRLLVRSRDPVTPVQVGLVEDFAQRVTGQRFTLIFDVSRVDEVTRQSTGVPSVGAPPTMTRQPQ